MEQLRRDLQRLADLQAIRALNRYCRLVDSRSPAAIATQAFAVDARGDHAIFGRTFRGRAEIEAMFRRSNETTECSAHVVAPSEIEIDCDTARARTDVTGWTWTRASATDGAVRPADRVCTGVHVDELRRTGGGRLISERRIEPLGPGATGFGVRPDAYDQQLDPVSGSVEGRS